MIGAAYSIPGSIFRAYGGVLSDRRRRPDGHVLDVRGLGGRDPPPLLAAAERDRADRPSSAGASSRHFYSASS